ncbi:MAG: carbon storage regulator [Planctomycetes bacterium]|nr:carbon storage regulator [Planctomycetota bacterium]
MLVLSRKIGESVVMRLPNGQRIKVMVCERRASGAIALGFDAPASVVIFREELAGRMGGQGDGNDSVASTGAALGRRAG